MDIYQWSDELITFGVSEAVQDMYVMPQETEYVISFRKGNQQFEHQHVDSNLGEQLISRFKYLGQMDVGEKRRAQLGAISYQTREQLQRLRLSTVGDYRQRESLVVRFLHPFQERLPVYWLPHQLTILKKYIQQRGLYLFSGPVGSGKTTLMYQLAREWQKQVITIEDPVEIEEPQFLQLQINPKIKQTYEALIKLSLRHHPDLLILGEIRDSETAWAAVQAALAGHCIFATIHAKSLPGIFERLKELGIGELDIQEALAGMIYQELLSDDKGDTGVLMAYRFVKGRQIVAEETWEDSCQQFEKVRGSNET